MEIKKRALIETLFAYANIIAALMSAILFIDDQRPKHIVIIIINIILYWCIKNDVGYRGLYRIIKQNYRDFFKYISKK